MLLVGITGSIGSGKSTVTTLLQGLGYEVFDADACVHKLYQHEAVQAVGAFFPSCIIKGKVDRAALSKILAKDPASFKVLESIIHPLVNQKKHVFLRSHLKIGTRVVFFDIPLLFETKQQDLFDRVLVISVSEQIRQQRVLQRKNMTKQKLELILQKQMPDEIKIKQADDVIYNNDSLEVLEQALEYYLSNLNKLIEDSASGENIALKNWDLS